MLQQRGAVVPLSDTQIVNRWLYLAGLRKIDDLDPYVRTDGAPQICPALYYLLHDHNGGKDPTAPDPADRWSNPGSTFVNRTADCVAGALWGVGADRCQPQRAGHIPCYQGWLNTDSMRWEARQVGRCFRIVPRPEPGTIVVYGSDPEHRTLWRDHRLPPRRVERRGSRVLGCDRGGEHRGVPRARHASASQPHDHRPAVARQRCAVLALDHAALSCARAADRDRTCDRRFTKTLLYQLSYRGVIRRRRRLSCRSPRHARCAAW